MGKRADITVEEVAEIKRKNPQLIRMGLQQGRYDFGIAIQKANGRWAYDVVFPAFCEHMRTSEEEMRKRVNLIRKRKERIVNEKRETKNNSNVYCA